MQIVPEYSGRVAHLERDTKRDRELVFPNVQSCLAIIAKDGHALVGLHMTIGDRKAESLQAISNHIRSACAGSVVGLYFIGRIGAFYNRRDLKAHFGAAKKGFFRRRAYKSRYFDVDKVKQEGPLGVDIRALLQREVLTFTWQNNTLNSGVGIDTTFANGSVIPLRAFSPL